MSEIFVSIPGYENRYEVSDQGRVRSLYLNKQVILKPETKRDTGYQRVVLCVNNVRKHYSVHTLVLLAFVGPCPDGYECLHGDNNPRNNSLDNLRWGTRSENCLERDLIPPDTKLSAIDVYYIRYMHSLGTKARQLSRELDISRCHIYKILRGECHKYA